jgi:hypothetical protein
VEAKSRTVLFVLSDDILDSAWCVAELVAAVKNNVKVVLVVKEGARWPDKDGKFVCTFPPDAIIQRLPADVQAGAYTRSLLSST